MIILPLPVLSKKNLETLPTGGILSECERITFFLASLSNEIPTGTMNEIGRSAGVPVKISIVEP
jgi:hypothetical protein